MEYIKEIGAGAIWLSPIFQSPMYDFGYDIADFYAIHDEYGTMDDFDELLAKANELGKLSLNIFIFFIKDPLALLFYIIHSLYYQRGLQESTNIHLT